MDLEDSIVAGDYLDHHQLAMLDMLPQLDVDTVANFVGMSSVDLKHIDLAHDIVANKHTRRRWRDYVYCAICIGKQDEYATDPDVAIAIYCLQQCEYKTDLVRLFIKMFYSATLMIVPGPKHHVYKYFLKGIWVDIDLTELRRMVCDRIGTTGLYSVMQIPLAEVERVCQQALAGFSGSSTCATMFYPRFDNTKDDKESIFAMPTTSYDIKLNVLRRPLPSDEATLRGGIDPCAVAEYTSKRDAMLKVLCNWMSGMDVVESYLDVVACAVGEFKPRYIIINSGTGSDGKSTWSHILQKLFGGYYAPLPSAGFSVDTKNSNDATPVLNTLVGKRLCITPDAKDVVSMLTSPGFKTITGGDEIYRRGLHKEATADTRPLKLLGIINTNETAIEVASLSACTRARMARWVNKTITLEDRAIVPAHQLTNSRAGVFNYERKFLAEYGGTLMLELLTRHRRLATTGYNIVICDKMRQWTRELISPKTILLFLEACTDKVPDDASNTAIVEYGADDSPHTPVADLFVAYVSWRKGSARFSRTDPTNLQSFTCHLEFYHPIHMRKTSTGLDEPYVTAVRLKPEYEMLSTMHNSRMFSQFGSATHVGGFLQAPMHLQGPVIHLGS